MFHVDKVNPDKGGRNKRLTSSNATNNNLAENSDNADNEKRSKERETQHKAEENRRHNATIDDLNKYATSFKNGTINTTPDNGFNDESDKDMGCVGDEDNNRKRQTSNYAYKPAEGSDGRGY